MLQSHLFALQIALAPLMLPTNKKLLPLPELLLPLLCRIIVKEESLLALTAMCPATRSLPLRHSLLLEACHVIVLEES